MEDSRVVSEYLEFILSSDPEIKVIGNVSNGKLAVEFIKHNIPDVITMDIEMPVMNGLDATREIMTTTPVPIIIVTGSKNANEIKTSMEALAAGAVTLIEKPLGIGHPNEEENTKKLVTMVKLMSEIKVITRRSKPVVNKIEISNKLAKQNISIKEFLSKKIVAIGVSSGGPPVLHKIFSGITSKFPVPIVVIQHITEGFLAGMTKWLNDILKIPVHIAANFETLLPGHIYFGPENYLTSVTKTGKIILSKEQNKNSQSHTVSYLFNSIAENYQKDSIVMLLTGMGNDGANELKKIRNCGAITIAQDKVSSLVHGMPGTAIKLDAAEYILNPQEIADILTDIENISL